MATDSQAMGLLIRIMPLMMREFALRVEPAQFFSDSGYAQAILDAAETATEPRLQGYARQLRTRLAELSQGPPGALRSAPSPAQQASPSGPRAAAPGATPAAGRTPRAAPAAAASTQQHEDTVPGAEDAPSAPAQPAVKYTRSLR